MTVFFATFVWTDLTQKDYMTSLSRSIVRCTCSAIGKRVGMRKDFLYHLCNLNPLGQHPLPSTIPCHSSSFFFFFRGSVNNVEATRWILQPQCWDVSFLKGYRNSNQSGWSFSLAEKLGSHSCEYTRVGMKKTLRFAYLLWKTCLSIQNLLCTALLMWAICVKGSVKD